MPQKVDTDKPSTSKGKSKTKESTFLFVEDQDGELEDLSITNENVGTGSEAGTSGAKSDPKAKQPAIVDNRKTRQTERLEKRQTRSRK